VPALIAASAPDALHVDETARLVEPLPSLASGRVALVGDAAHAMMPDLGQGGCQALEDAVALGDLLTGADPGEVEALLRRYDRRRRPRTSQLIAGASRLNRLFGLTGPAAAVRDTLLRLIPAALATRVLARQFRFAG
jgi:2-polyprenyl-6-methoxyphenol hydroxylase-like FAD-dependent oxidoreductase